MFAPRPSRSVVSWFACAVVFGCSAAVQPDEEEMIEIPLPAAAIQVDLKTAPGANAGDLPTEVYPIKAITKVRAVVDAQGRRHVAMQVERHVVKLVCNDFGCTRWWMSEPFDVCLNVDQTPTVSTDPECTRALSIPLDAPPPDPDGLVPHLSAAAGAPVVTVTHTGGTTLSTSTDGSTVEWVGGAKTELPLDAVYGDWLSSGTSLTQYWAVRATFVNGRLSGAPVVEPAPGGVDYLQSLTVLEDAAGVRSLLLKTRESGLISLVSTPGPMTGHFVGEGYHLYPDPQWSRSDTVGAFVVGDSLVELFLAPGVKTLGMLDPGANMGGRLRPGDLYVHVRRAETSAPAPFHPFTLLHARALVPDVVVACLDRPYDPASLASATASIEPETAVVAIEATFVPSCVAMRAGALEADTGHRLTLAGLKDLAGATLAPTTTTFLSAGAPMLDLATMLVGPSGSTGLYPLASGSVLDVGRLLEWGPDLFTRRVVEPAFAGTVLDRAYDPVRARLWMLLDNGSERRVASYDGRTLREYLPTEHPRLAGVTSMRLLGDGSLVAGGASFARIDGETITDFPGDSAVGVVLGSSDYIEARQGQFTRKKVDGTVVQTFAAGDAWAGVNTYASEGGVDYACSSQGFFLVEGATATALTWEGARIYSCTSMQPLLGGGLSVRIPTGGYVPILLQVRGAETRNAVRPDPFIPETSYRYVYGGMEVGARTYFWAIGDFGNEAAGASTLRLTDRAGYDELFDGVWP